MLINNLERKGQKPAWIHYFRNFWLLLFGLAHSVLLWSGDVLLVYALSAFVLYFFRKMSPKWQFGLGLVVFLMPAFFQLTAQVILPTLDPASHASLRAYWQPNNADIADSIAFYQGDYLPQVAYRWGTSTAGDEAYTTGEALYDVVLLVDFFARALGAMMVGMSLYTWGILTAKRSNHFYEKMVKIGFGVGYPLAILGWLLSVSQGWAYDFSLFLGRVPNQFATLFIASGYIGLVMFWSRSERWAGLQSRLVAVGRTALTNYILQSVLGTALFYGFGLGLFGTVSRLGLLAFIGAIWLFQLYISPIWLTHFRFGPLEWLWRSLTYLKLQPLRKQTPILA